MQSGNCLNCADSRLTVSHNTKPRLAYEPLPGVAAGARGSNCRARSDASPHGPGCAVVGEQAAVTTEAYRPGVLAFDVAL